MIRWLGNFFSYGERRTHSRSYVFGAGRNEGLLLVDLTLISVAINACNVKVIEA